MLGDVAEFVFPTHGIFVLCFKHSHTPYLPWVLWPDLRTAAVLIAPRPVPHATAVGCVSDLTVRGIGFSFFGVGFPDPPALVDDDAYVSLNFLHVV